jgi:hypothetical protein
VSIYGSLAGVVAFLLLLGAAELVHIARRRCARRKTTPGTLTDRRDSDD